MATIIGKNGQQHEVKPSFDWYVEAHNKSMSVRDWVNSTFETDSKVDATAFDMVLASSGIVLRSDRESGLLSTRVGDMLRGGDTLFASTGGIVASPDSAPGALRTLFPVTVLAAMEDRLIKDMGVNVDVFDSMIAVSDTSRGGRFDRPLFNYDGTYERSRAVAQLAPPPIMTSITLSPTSRTIPTRSIGLEISDEASKATTLDMVGLALARQAMFERNARIDEFFLGFLQGDADNGDTSSLAGLGLRYTAKSFDPSITVAGSLTQTAWMSWLLKDSLKRRISHVVTDINGALAIQNRTGAPTVNTDNPYSHRINTGFNVINPTWANEVQVYIATDPAWPAGTIMGLDKRFAIHYVENIDASYSAAQEMVMHRKQQVRIDAGYAAYRLYPEAFSVLDLALA